MRGESNSDFIYNIWKQMLRLKRCQKGPPISLSATLPTRVEVMLSWNGRDSTYYKLDSARCIHCLSRLQQLWFHSIVTMTHPHVHYYYWNAKLNVRMRLESLNLLGKTKLLVQNGKAFYYFLFFHWTSVFLFLSGQKEVTNLL